MKSKLIQIVLPTFLVVMVHGCWAASSGHGSSEASSSQSAAASGSNLQSETGEKKPGKSQSGRYKLVKDGNKELCKLNPLLCDKPKDLCSQLENNFNSFLNDPPMVCERKFNPEFGFTTPDWRPVRTEDIDWELLKRIYFSKNKNRFSKAGLDKSWPEERARLRELSDKQVIVWRAEFDVDNKEGEEKILMLKDSDCSVDKYFEYNAPDPSLHVIDESDNNLSDGYGRLDYYSFDIFRYKNHTYLSAWKGLELGNSGAQIYIYDAFKPSGSFGFDSKYGCTYQYIR